MDEPSSCILMLGISIVEFEVQNLNFSKMWLDLQQNIKSTNARVVRVLKLFLLNNTFRNNAKLLEFPRGKNGKSSCS